MSGVLQRRVGANIRLLRQRSGRSQEQFAEEVGLDHSYLGKIERGERNGLTRWGPQRTARRTPAC